MMRRVTIRNILLIIVLAVAFGLGMRMWTHRPEPVSEPPVDSLPANTDLALQDIQYTETSDGLRRWMLTAKSAAYDDQQSKSTVQDMRVEFFDKQGRVQMTLTSREGVWFSETGEIEARGNVVVKTTEGYTVYTERLRYRSRADEVSTDLPVRVESVNMRLSARGMRYRVKERLLTLDSQVKASLPAGIGN